MNVAPRSLIALCGAGLAIAACRSVTSPDEKAPSLHGDEPAVIVNPTDESRAELRQVVSDMLFGAEVALADDALTKSSVLVIERSRIRNLDDKRVSGRDLGEPQRFQLLTTGTECVLIHSPNLARYELTRTDCVPEE